MRKHVILPETIWDPAEHLFSQCVAVTGAERTLYISGQSSIDAHGVIIGIDDVEQQIRCAFANVATIVSYAGGALDNVVKLTAYFLNMAALGIYTQVLGELFPTIRPAQTVVQVAGLAVPELLFELEATAVL